MKFLIFCNLKTSSAELKLPLPSYRLVLCMKNWS